METIVGFEASLQSQWMPERESLSPYPQVVSSVETRKVVTAILVRNMDMFVSLSATNRGIEAEKECEREGLGWWRRLQRLIEVSLKSQCRE